MAFDSNAALGTVHFADARAERGEGKRIAGRAHLSGLFVLPARWGEGIGSALLEAALAEMRRRRYREAQLFTAAANQRSRIVYERWGWRATATNTHKHDDLWLASYERSLTGLKLSRAAAQSVAGLRAISRSLLRFSGHHRLRPGEGAVATRSSRAVWVPLPGHTAQFRPI